MQSNTKKVLPHINTLYDLFKAFAAARGKRGAIDFETTETEIRFDDNARFARSCRWYAMTRIN